MSAFAQDTELVKRKIMEFANLKRRTEVAVGLSILSGVPAEQIDRLLHTANGFGLMVLCKSLAMEWQDAYVVIMASHAAGTIHRIARAICRTDGALRATRSPFLARPSKGRQAHFSKPLPDS